MLILLARLLFMTAVWRVAEGKASLPYSPIGQTCDNSTSEYYLKNLKICCSKCKPGTHLEVQCNENADTICAPCEDGQYSDLFTYFQNCFSCPSCKEDRGLIYGKKCSADTKPVCVCKPGMFCYNYDFSNECERCRKYKSCKPGEHITSRGSPKADVKCEPCPSGTFSNHINAESCQPHTKCGSVLRLGNSTADTQCDRTALPSITTEVSLQVSSRHPQPSNINSLQRQTEEVNVATTTSLLPSSSVSTAASRATTSSNPDTLTLISCTVILCVLVLLTAVMVITCKLRKRKAGLQKVPITGANKLEQVTSESGIAECQHLLPTDKLQKEPSMTSSDSQSQPDSSQSHSSGDWLERTSQEESLPELPSVSSPLVNLNITATFKCQLNSSALTPHVEAPLPLSQEEVCISCQQEDGKEALQSVQESGLCAF
ncbi:tumor necrosis factor receptor superfamily member 1B [Pseudorasbora parva]|uniref:tumor necrosis factor receptor superfamily member 1B n=1 Tax=Pseudorasbora parva TaxID=51549 RepID=UPI00351F7006